MKKMSKEVLITHYKNQYLIVLTEMDRAVEIYLKDEEAVEIGDVFIGKVKNIADNIQAAFVEFQPGIIGYYGLRENPNHLFVSKEHEKLRPGDEILVQVERGAVKSKAPVLTSQIQLSGEKLVFVANSNFSGISKKIHSEKRRQELKALGHQWYEAGGHGVIFRTQSEAADEETLAESYRQLMVDYNNILSTARTRTCFSRLYRQENNWLRYVHADQPMELRIQTDIREIYDKFSQQDRAEGHVWEFYSDESYPLMKLKNLERTMERALAKNVWLKSGGTLVIEPTEALTVIDVNTGKTELRRRNSDIFYQINVEAATEICRQLRLRNLSGMILVDFINMSSESSRQALMTELKRMAKMDPVQTEVIDMTPLGLVEMTRKRTYRPIYEQLNRK